MLDRLPAALGRLRLSARLTQVEASARAGLSRSALSKYENGKKTPELPSLFRLLSAYGATLHDLQDALDGLPVEAPPPLSPPAALPREEMKSLLRELLLELQDEVRKP